MSEQAPENVPHEPYEESEIKWTPERLNKKLHMQFGLARRLAEEMYPGTPLEGSHLMNMWTEGDDHGPAATFATFIEKNIHFLDAFPISEDMEVAETPEESRILDTVVSTMKEEGVWPERFDEAA